VSVCDSVAPTDLQHRPIRPLHLEQKLSDHLQELPSSVKYLNSAVDCIPQCYCIVSPCLIAQFEIINTSARTQQSSSAKVADPAKFVLKLAYPAVVKISLKNSWIRIAIRIRATPSKNSSNFVDNFSSYQADRRETKAKT